MKSQLNRIKCRIPGTRPIYSPVNFPREHVGQIIFLHFSNSLVNMLAKSLVKMLAEGMMTILAWLLVKILTESLLNMLSKSPLRQNSDKHKSQSKYEYLFNTMYEVWWKQQNYFKVFFKIWFFCGWPEDLKLGVWFCGASLTPMKMCFLVYLVKNCKSSFLVEEQVSNYSNVSEKFLLDDCCFAFLLRFLPI